MKNILREYYVANLRCLGQEQGVKSLLDSCRQDFLKIQNRIFYMSLHNPATLRGYHGYLRYPPPMAG